VGYVHVGHEQAVVAYRCFEFVVGAAVNGNALSDFSVVTDFHSCVFVAKLEVLWNHADTCARKDIAVFSDARTGIKHGIGVNVAAIANDDVRVDHRKGVYAHILANLGVEGYRS